MRWTWVRRGTQLAFLAVFLWLFRRTESGGTDDLNASANLLFRLDPLVGVSAMLAARELVAAMWPALITVILTLALGRFFCGWVCPLGTLLDITSRLRPGRPRAASARGRGLKYLLLGVVLASAVFGVQLIGYLNPFSILVRGLTVAVDPVFTWALTAPFTWLLRHAPESVTQVSEPVYAWLKAHVLPFQQAEFMWPGVALAILGAVFGLELAGRRLWCRTLCPTGALLGWLARFSLLRRSPGRVCPNCKAVPDCAGACRMGAFDAQGRLLMESCNLCMDCVDRCPAGAARFRFRRPAAAGAPAPFEPSRRWFLGSLAAGAALPVVARATGVAHRLPEDLIRPPGALPESEFLELCVRCAECMKVCTTNGLQPVLFEAGLAGTFSPRLVARMGYCEYNCTLCAQVCPTGAIRRLPLAEKQTFVMGKAVFDPAICLPYAKAESCLTCEEHCPLPEKAIRLREVEVLTKTGERVVVQQPFTVLRLCIGCGICVAKCPVEGAAGVRIVRAEAVPPGVRREYEALEASTPAAAPDAGRVPGY
ncbi:MAG: 4Fe-4S binding protein [Verrucomicrobia bacterium]|nr:4Fe-4S binding protein [Verrucomicrobiota bacterium]